MKKRQFLLFYLVPLLIGAFLLLQSGRGVKPFRGISLAEIVRVTVQLSPPEKTIKLTDSEIAELAGLLQPVTLYQKDSSYREYTGQWVLITITKTDGTQTTATPFSPFFILDGTGYKTSHEPCERLNSWANQLRA